MHCVQDNCQEQYGKSKKTTILKRAFAKFGVTDHNKKLKDMDEKEEFGALVNWALNELPSYEHM